MADSILRLRVEDKEYNASLKQARQGLLALQQALQQSGATFQHVDKATVEYARGLGRMETVAKTAKGRIGEMTSAFTDLRMQYKQLSDAEKNSPFGKAMNQSLNELRGRIQETKKQMSDVDNELKVAKVDTTDFSGVIGELGSKLGVSSELMGVLTTGTMGYAAAIGASVTAVIAATKAWVDYNSELAKQTQITTVTTGLSGSNAGDMTSFGRSVASTYGVDFREVINAANTLMQQFGKSGEEAMQIIRDGMQGMVQGDGPKLLSMIQQYAPSFRDAGISAKQLVAIIQNSEGGIFTDQNMNAIVMGIKNLRLMTNATAEALQKVGINSEEMTQKLNDGSITIFDAMRQVSEAIERTGASSQAAGEVMQQVFGRQGTAAGTNLGKAIASLNTNLDETKLQTGSIGKEFAKLQKSSEDLENAMRDCFGFTEIDDLEAKLRTTFNNSLTKVIDGVAKLKNIWEEFENLVGRNVAANAFKLLAARITQMLHPMMLVYNEAAKLFALFGSDSGRGGGWFKKIGNTINSSIDNMVLTATGQTGGGGGGYVPPAGGGAGGGRGGRGGGGRGGGSTTTPVYVPVEGSIDYQTALVADLQKQWKAAADDDSRARIKSQIDAANKELERMQGKVEDIDLSKMFPEGSMATGDERTFAQKMMDSIKTGMSDANLDADTNTMKTMLQTIIENGLEGLDINWDNIGEQIFSDMGVPDEKWQELLDQINEKLAELDIKPIEIDFSTGNVKKQAKEMNKDWQMAASAIQAVGSAMSQIEDPAAKVLGTIAQAIATIAQGFAIATSKEANKGVWGWIAAVAAGTATMLSTIATIKSATKGFANGGIVPGNSYSGDNLRTSDYGVNSGELILNRAQQNNIAAQLQGGGMQNLNLTATVTGEQIRLALNNTGRRTGNGEYLKFK